MLKFLFSQFNTQNLPLIIGICTGIAVGLFITPVFEDECNFRLPLESQIIRETSPSSGSIQKANAPTEFDDYEPRINLNSKPQSAKKEPQALIRPRYYSTELGVKQKLFIAVLSSIKSIPSLGPAINWTLAGQRDVKISFFVDISSGEKPNLKTLPVIGFMDNNQGFLSLHTLKYLADKLAKNYSFFLLVKDTTYVNGRRISDILDHISVSEDLYMGKAKPSESGGIDVCSLDAGILISSSVLQSLSEMLEECSGQVAFDTDDEKIGRCINSATNLTCTPKIREQVYQTHEVSESIGLEDLDESLKLANPEISQLTTVHPVKDPATFYFLDKRFNEAALGEISRNIAELQDSIENVAPKTPAGFSSVTWPVGFAPPSVPPSRFDVMRWEFFNSTHVFLDKDQNVVGKLQGIHADDIQEIISLGVKYVSKEEDLGFVRLENGYRRFDATRGMDYMLDIVFRSRSGEEFRRHIELCRPITHVDTVPMPYMTESARINLVLPLWDASQTKAAETFVQQFASGYMAKSENIDLYVVFLNGSQDTVTEFRNTGQRFNSLYKKEGLKISVQNFRLPRNAQLELIEFIALDFVSSKIAAENLVFLFNVHAELNADLLNRVRINTISGWQIFNPIPFADYNPEVAFPNGKKPEEGAISTNTGFFDTSFTQFISFYMTDYLSARKLMESELPFLSPSMDRWKKYNPRYKSIYSLFVGQRKLHVLRAVEPLLRLHYHTRLCYEDESCVDGFLRSQGTKSQLAKLIMEQNEHSLR